MLRVNCGKCLEKLEGFMDRELNEGEMAEVRQHLSDCAPCEDLFDLQVGMKRLVKRCCDQSTAPAQLRERLSQILG